MPSPPADAPGRRVAVLFQGDPSDPTAWSGAPAGLLSGLAEIGVEPVAIDARFPGVPRLARSLKLSWKAQATSPVLAAAGGLAARASIARAGGIEAAILIGSGYSLRAPVPTATFDDMTVAQALAQPDSEYSGLPPRAARRWRARQGRGYARAGACCLASRWAAASVRDDYGIDPAKVHVVGLGHSSPAGRVERDWSRPRFVFIGFEWERKQGQAVLEAFARVRKRHPEARLELIGGHPEVEAPGVTGHGVLSLDSAADRERRAEILARSTCLVLPSKFEPFGIAYVDAGASGVPSIGTSRGGAADAIGEGGILVDPGDRAGLLEAMLGMCNRETARRFGERASAHAAGLTWQAVAKRVLLAIGLD
jgi:glycosyltransferase involved in cell wall biosynthesis